MEDNMEKKSDNINEQSEEWTFRGIIISILLLSLITTTGIYFFEDALAILIKVWEAVSVTTSNLFNFLPEFLQLFIKVVLAYIGIAIAIVVFSLTLD